ncbi:hypothetical protein F5887DRAFT_1440 [Amanita rubescens]|nr:hypothetical protein F5887DRAFT_1440 [Amanita rubescens]
MVTSQPIAKFAVVSAVSLTMDLINSERASPFQSQNDHASGESQENTLSLTQKQERLKHIEHEIEHLIEMKREIEGDHIRLGVAYAHRNHATRLPNEVLSRVFVLIAQDHGSVDFPIRKKDIPPQFALSHVCSYWRSVALRTSELWSNTFLQYSPDRNIIRIHQRWLLRAGTFPVTLTINFNKSLNGYQIADALRSILPPLEVKRLYLDLTFQKFMELSTISETTFSGLVELELKLALCQSEVNTEIQDPHHLMARLRSVSFYSDKGCDLDLWLHKLSSSLPWSQLRSMDVNVIPSDLRIIVNILRQMPILQSLSLVVAEFHLNSSLEELTLPSLLDFSLEIQIDTDIGRMEIDEILRSFTCPCLTKFTLTSDWAGWTHKTFGILTQQYNMQNLQEVKFVGGFALALSISSILRNAPMLRSLSVRRNGILDDQAIAGISDGTLGRCLQRLEISTGSDLGEVLDMAAARKKKVDEMIKNGCGWKEEITLLNEIDFVNDSDCKLKCDDEEVWALEEAGITISQYDANV